MKILNTLHRSLSTTACLAVAIAALGTQATAQSVANAQAGKLSAPELQVLDPAPAGSLAGGTLSLPPTPTFEGDIVVTGDIAGGLIVGSSATGTGVHFSIALVDGSTLTWAAAPTQVRLEVGDHILLQIADGRPHLVQWSGAEPVAITDSSSQAEFRATASGVQLVQARLVTPQGQSLGIARLVIDVAEPGGSIGGGTPAPVAKGACSLSMAQLVPGITSTFIAVVPISNTGKTATTFSFKVAATAPGTLSWSVTPPDDIVLGAGESGIVYVAFALLDIDVIPHGSTARPLDHATLTLSAYGKQGPALMLGGGAKKPACSVTLVDVCVGCLWN